MNTISTSNSNSGSNINSTAAGASTSAATAATAALSSSSTTAAIAANKHFLSQLGDASGVAILLGNHAKFGLSERCR